MAELKKEENKLKAQEQMVEDRFTDSKSVKTEHMNLSDIIKLKIDQIEDLATLEIAQPVESRLRHRLKSLKEQTSARHIRVRRNAQDKGHWKTTQPKFFIKSIEGRKISNDTAEIKIEVYEMDEDGNKKLFEQINNIPQADGTTIRKITSCDYRVSHEVVEILKFGKPITRQIIKLDTI
jgi:hypothetical protein